MNKPEKMLVRLYRIRKDQDKKVKSESNKRGVSEGQIIRTLIDTL